MSPAIKCLILLAVIALFFVTEFIPLAITAIGGAVACGLLGLIPAKQVFSGLSNSTVVLFAGMFVVGAAMFYTGLAQAIGEKVVHIFGTGENSLMLGLMLVGTALSTLLSNTGTCACLMPVALGICAASKNPASRQLLPMAYACGWGGIITLVGTPPNIIGSGALTAAGLPGFSFFEFAWIGIPLSVAGILYMLLIGKYLLPKAELDADQEIEQEIEATTHDKKKQMISGMILLVCVIVMALDFKFISLEMTAIIGALVSPICYFALSVLKPKFGYDDALDAFGCHGIGGIWGGIATGLFAQTSINPVAKWDGLVFGDYHLFVAQVLSILVTIAVAVVGTLICVGIVRLFTKLRVDENSENVGLDDSEHGECAYSAIWE